MASSLSLPEQFKIVTLAVPAAANAMAYDYICCKNAHKVWFIVQHYSAGGDTDLVLTFVEAKTVGAGSAQTIAGGTMDIWQDIDTSSVDALVKATAATSHTIDTEATKPQLCVFEWDCSKFSTGYDCITITDTGGNASNIASAIAIIQERYPQATPPSAIID